MTPIIRVISCDFTAILLGFSIILGSGCGREPTAPTSGSTSGAIAVTVSTAGANVDLDPDGYALSVDGGPGEAVGVNAAVKVADLPTGNHQVELTGVSGNCAVDGTNPRTVNVAFGATAEVAFTIRCLPQASLGPQLAFIWTRETGMIALPLLPGATSSAASAINDLGQVVGTVIIGQREHAFAWTLASGMVDIGGLSGAVRSYASAINNAGQVAGYSEDASGHARAFRWSPSEGMIALGALPGTVSSYARSINSSGHIVGAYGGTFSGGRPFRWTPERGMEDIGSFGSDPDAGATAVNNNGDIVGSSGDGSVWLDFGIQGAVLWSANGEKRVIEGCTTVSAGFNGCVSWASAINGAGQIAGHSGVNNHAFRWTVAGDAQDLGTLPGSNYSYAEAINETGQVVGTSSGGGGAFGRGHAFLWSPTGGMVDLGVLNGREWSSATGINKSGQVVGTSGVNPFYASRERSTTIDPRF